MTEVTPPTQTSLFLSLIVADETTDFLFSVPKFEGRKLNISSPEMIFLCVTNVKVWGSVKFSVRYYNLARCVAKCLNFK